MNVRNSTGTNPGFNLHVVGIIQDSSLAHFQACIIDTDIIEDHPVIPQNLFKLIPNTGDDQVFNLSYSADNSLQCWDDNFDLIQWFMLEPLDP